MSTSESEGGPRVLGLDWRGTWVWVRVESVYTASRSSLCVQVLVAHKYVSKAEEVGQQLCMEHKWLQVKTEVVYFPGMVIRSFRENNYFSFSSAATHGLSFTFVAQGMCHRAFGVRRCTTKRKLPKPKLHNCVSLFVATLKKRRA